MVDQKKIASNAADIEREIAWFREILRTRSLLNVQKETKYSSVYEIEPPYHNGSVSSFAAFVKKNQFDFEERFLLALALVPHVKPELLDLFLVKNENTNQVYTEFGGKAGKNHNGFIPTGETAMFILAGNDLSKRFSLQRCFDGLHRFSRENILWLEEIGKDEPALSGAINISQEVLDLFTLGEARKPNFSPEFPAKLLTTKMEWADLILSHDVMTQIEEIETWINHQHTLMGEWEMDRILKPGYKSLFHGPSGTGKTTAAALIGKKTGRDVYRIDLSQMVSKYIGETEKNLSKVFDRAENKEWILFFDEADALFGKRTDTRDSHDRFANQQVSYLLQRIEDFNGLVILASNLKGNIDEAFIRRFQSIIQFPMPSTEERRQIWQNSFPKAVRLESEIDINEIARKYEISGGAIINIIQHCSLRALARGTNEIRQADMIEGIRREYHKNRRTL
ncbi:ATP-binding protein [Mangrovibacterium diazotrophicum]|uniref:ATPase family protein associated with various cellular activities (AAA) n=1 Tax=Mangrovibacterium diazotrophicum TaxID=1261403 RepID=A0A419VYP1_9BACT|nr:ATP-binding protein [Mangrovibacterium diazotrophicum]RKD88357.1 ATPase family protein associated with various cellular activities (AAA) [Mangrovibacterium diazotrophicum]